MSRVWEIWLSGGLVMVPLFGLAVLIYAQAFQLVMYMRRTQLDPTGEMHWREWVRDPGSAEGRVSEIIRFTQDGVRSEQQLRGRFDEVRLSLLSLIDRRTHFVSTLVTAAPLMGLLGTVMGMLQTFLGISTSGGSETAGVVAAGISEALVTTQTGLTIALPGLFVVMLIQRQRQQLAARISRLESLTLGQLRFEPSGVA